MATAHLKATAYSRSNNSYVTVTNPTNMYDPVSDTSNYATLQGRTRNSSTAYYCFINGFSFSDLPAGANVSAFSVKIRCYRNSTQRTGTNYYLRLCSSAAWNTAITGTTTSTNVGTTSDVITIPTGNLTWSQITNYGSGFSIAVPLAGTSGSTAPQIYVYGAEIEVTYSAETVHVTGVSLDKNSDTVAEFSTTQLTATVSPNNATDKSVTWSSSNTAVATVDSTGLVTGVSAGSATITVTTTDGGYTATCAVTVTAVPKVDYKLTNTMQPGKEYIIATGNSGSVYMLSKNAGSAQQLVGVSATVENSIISIPRTVAANVVFECGLTDQNNQNTTHLKNGNQYLRANNANGLHMSATDDRWWHLRDGKFWLWTSSSDDGYTDTSSNYKYYLQYTNGGIFTAGHVTSPSIEDSTLPEIYLFVKYEGADDTLYAKISGSWVEIRTAYKKINGAWVEQQDLTSLFNNIDNFRKGD